MTGFCHFGSRLLASVSLALLLVATAGSVSAGSGVVACADDLVDC